MNKTFLVGLMALFLVISMPSESALRIAPNKAPQAVLSDLQFAVANQAYVITDSMLAVQISVASGNPNQIKFVPSQAAQNSGFVVADTNWVSFNPANGVYKIARPTPIKAGEYECIISLRDSLVPDSVVSESFKIELTQISFNANRVAIVCDELGYKIEIQDIVGAPNQIKLLSDSVAQSHGIHETAWMDFDIENPYITIDLSGVEPGDIITDSVHIGLRDKNNFDTVVVEKPYSYTVLDTVHPKYSIIIDTTEIYTLDTLVAPVDTIINGVEIHAGEEYYDTIYTETFRYDSVYAVEYEVKDVVIDSVFALSDTTIYLNPADSTEVLELHPGDLIRLDTSYIIVTIYDTVSTAPQDSIIERVVVDNDSIIYSKELVYYAWAAIKMTQVGRGMEGDYINTKFDNCLIFVDNSGHTQGSLLFTSYQWYKNGVLINGATDQYFYETDEYGNMIPLNGSYSVVVTTTDGLTTSLCPLSFNSTQNSPKRLSSIVYPVPVEQGKSATLRTFYSDEELENAVMRIYDIQGNLAYIKLGLSEYNTLPVLPANMYIVLVETSMQTETIKFIVK